MDHSTTLIAIVLATFLVIFALSLMHNARGKEDPIVADFRETLRKKTGVKYLLNLFPYWILEFSFSVASLKWLYLTMIGYFDLVSSLVLDRDCLPIYLLRLIWTEIFGYGAPR